MEEALDRMIKNSVESELVRGFLIVLRSWEGCFIFHLPFDNVSSVEQIGAKF